MEYFWYVIASLFAGIGTGLAGLSAATVMVPILLVLCPSFHGETGAYQATAIALASDILGSAVTTSIYIKHKNIDLRHGWIMLVCIVSMCIGGSIAAWKAGNVVLGTFSLFLTFFIGIRFLAKPDTERKEVIAKDAKLGVKGIIISLFFGLTIGFGTGFFGSGGGMMMLVVFTAFLGMPMKSAVGTSTLIMTFTALIASISHIIIEPAIVLERANVLLLCIVVATIASLVSAQFANRFSTKMVGLVTGVVLTILGATMLCLHYWNILSNIPYVIEILLCLGKYLIFIGSAVVILLILFFVFKIRGELFRKLLHIPAFCSVVAFVFFTNHWIVASMAALLFAAAIYPILMILEKFYWYSELFVQRRQGEVKKSLWLLFTMTAVVIAITWGGLDKSWIGVTAILMWGCGDGMAALVGKKFGKHKVHLKFADEKKSWEGTVAMMGTAFFVGTISLLLLTEMPWYQAIVLAVLTAPCGAYTELITHHGNDTVTVPIVNMILLIVSMNCF